MHRVVIAIFLLTLAIPTGIFAEECLSMDLRNFPRAEAENIAKLKNCTAILGFLQIVLMETSEEKAFENMEFPLLREVTGFVLLYRVRGLTTIGKLFPNLAVIRGQIQIAGYSLIVYGMPTLEYIGLTQLEMIEQGAVRIENNPKLCDAERFQWNKITKSLNSVENYFSENGHLCQCLVDCKRKYKIPVANLEKCDTQCLIGCKEGGSESDCYVCSQVKDEDKCLSMCPEEKLTDSWSLRCLSKETCVAIKRYVFKQTCLEMCPPEHSDLVINETGIFQTHICKPCNESCKKVCRGKDVRHVSDAADFRGCDIVTEKLDIQIVDEMSTVIENLTEYFKSIKDVYGYVKVSHSSLTSLNFFKNLQNIHGGTFKKKKLALIIYENDNLQELWNPVPKFRVLSGMVSIHNNNRLCNNKLQSFIADIQLNRTNVFLGNGTNGSEDFCNIELLRANYSNVTMTDATLFWDAFTPLRDQEILGYLVYFIETPHKNMKYFYWKDSCSINSWNWTYVGNSNCDKKLCFWTLSGLESYTQYAFYVRADLYQSDSTIRRHVKSEIKYFKTEIDRLSQVSPLKTHSKTDTSITLEWSVFKNEEDLVNLYVVDILYQPDDIVIRDRNFCESPHEDFFSQHECEEISEVGMEMCTESHCRRRRSESIFDIRLYEYYFKTIKFSKSTAPNNMYKVEGLKPFSSYAFQFFACINEQSCGPLAYHSDRTAPARSGDHINASFEVTDAGVQMKLMPEGIQNSEFVSFIIETITSTSNISITCVTRQHLNSWQYVITDLPAGLFSIRLRAVSLAGLGPLTPWYNTTIFVSNQRKMGVTGVTLISLLMIGISVAGVFYAYKKRLVARILDRFRGGGDMDILVKAAFDSNMDEDIIIDRMQFNGKELTFEND